MLIIRLSRKSEYACLALIYLSRKYEEDQLSKMIDISNSQLIPKKYLEQIMLILKNGRFVQSIRGIGGGYRLAKAPENITIAEIIRLVDGPIAPVDSVSKYYYASTPIEKEDSLLNLFSDIRNMVSQKLETTTLKDLV